MHRRAKSLLAVVAGCCALTTSPAMAQPAIDRSFGKNGRVTLEGVPGHPKLKWREDFAVRILRVVGRRLYLVVQTEFRRDGFGGPPAVLRFDRRGRLDQSFGRDGVVLLDDSASWPAEFNDMVVAPDGDLVLVGREHVEGTYEGELDGDWAIVVRLDANGSRDRRFGRRGVVGSGFLGSAFSELDRARINTIDQVFALPSGKVIVGGNGYGRGRIVQLTRDGRRDRSFARNGTIGLPGESRLSSVAGATDGRIFATYSPGRIVAFSRGGARIRGFGTNGVLPIGVDLTRWWTSNLYANADHSFSLVGSVNIRDELTDFFTATVGVSGGLTSPITRGFDSLGLQTSEYGPPSFSVFAGRLAVDNQRAGPDRAIVLRSLTEQALSSAPSTEVFKPGAGHPRHQIALGPHELVLAATKGSRRPRLLIERFTLD